MAGVIGILFSYCTTVLAKNMVAISLAQIATPACFEIKKLGVARKKCERNLLIALVDFLETEKTNDSC